MKSVIITGAGTGLGRELALKYGKEGYHLILVGRSEETLLEVKKQLNNAIITVLDIRNKHEVDENIRFLFKEYNVVGLINNAGIGIFGPFVKIKENAIEEMFQTNVLGTMYMTQAVLPNICELDGSFVMNIISTAGLRGKVNEAAYVASKFAVRGFTESLQKEYEEKPVLISAVYMGGMNTPFWKGSEHVKDPSKFRSPAEVAETIFSQRQQEYVVIESK
ncbi:SDR family oxidoreductase [Robertmurraya korlensis]|uniref:SDR family NAD(P)-dependent oxidoreductase n=1 Tax=Robertmurraya korlensis TaxID=519977 RepID=UPI0020400A15|nr:SDR family oxidoreductase [Robertmurraya korlensis]MCM3601967.1 SDR family oxidoreductase [Robertmurraya korlensis]